ncbi:MAG: YmdB family metallophosphoesterase [Alphaproteobacteria bacterium]|nr:YmdB family metallophosphoesterase [Alphaproteobacteria bacterium]MDY4689843.1 TIGR00282 family metallophosphoesterase [Alphaproteobacteria bacterium]
MRIFYCGDIVARPGREVVLKNLAKIRTDYKADVIIANVENAAHGFGVTAGICRDFLEKGADVLVTGNHFLNQRDIVPYLDDCKVIVRPANIPNGNPGRGFMVYELADGRRLLIIQVLGRLYMEAVDCPVQTVDNILKNYTLGKNINAVFVDIHAEATSEKLALGYYLDGRASLVAGTHTHVPTADYRVLPQGTAYITDVGMCGCYNSVLGFDPAAPISRLRRCYVTSDKLAPATGDGTLYGVLVETDDKTGLAKSIQQLVLS